MAKTSRKRKAPGYRQLPLSLREQLERKAARPLDGLGREYPDLLKETREARAVLAAIEFWRELALAAQAEAQLLRESIPSLRWRGDGLWVGSLLVGKVIRSGQMWAWKSIETGPAFPRFTRPIPKKAARAALERTIKDMLAEAPAL